MAVVPGARPYHHGQLRDALIEAGVQLARDAGPEAVVLRAVSREAGVSHNAAYRHFADLDDLLRAVCERCMTALAELMERRLADTGVDPDPVANAWLRLDVLGRAYVEFALTQTGWFRTAFAVPAATDDFGPGEGAGPGGRTPYQLLGDALDALVAVGAIPAKRRPGAELSAWAAVHGLSTLMTSGPLRSLPPAEREQVIGLVLDATARGL